MIGQSTSADHEKGLVENLRRRRSELMALIEECSNHWGYEDPIYRFYHQSFKVYALQEQTTRIVRLLEELAPDRPLNSWFRSIVKDGTGKTFAQGDNADWARVTQPILKHSFTRASSWKWPSASTLPVIPSTLPSGYAALLCLYGLR